MSDELAVLDQRPIDELEMSVRAYNFLRKANISTVGALTELTELDLKMKGCGKRQIREIREILGSLNLDLAPGPSLSSLELTTEAFKNATRAARSLISQGYRVEIHTNSLYPESAFDVVARKSFNAGDDK